MFKPTYIITNQLLANIKRINFLITELNNRRFPHVVLAEFESNARAVSSYASTSIEGNPLPLTEVKKILKSAPIHIRESEREVLNYNLALKDLNEKLKKGSIKFSLNLILSVQKKIMQKLLPKYELGNLRQKPVIVNDPKSRKIIYLPPDHQDVEKLLEDLIVYINKNKNYIDPLILSGLFHKQMVIIHPFMDGNGRITRLTTKVLLAEMGLNTFNLFSFENYYNKNVTRYFQTIGETGNYYDIANKIEYTVWLEYFTEGIIDELLRAQKLFPELAKNPKNELQKYHLKILEFIKNKGFISDRDYKKLTNRARSTRALDFQKLIHLGLIQRKAKGKATYYVRI